MALMVILYDQSIPEPVLQTLLTEAEDMLNAKPLGHVITDLDLIMPSMVLMRHRDSSLPQALLNADDLSK